jgi:hypothetical protein
MHRSTAFFAFIITLLTAALPAHLSAQPIITGLPTDKSAFIGTANANVTLDVAAFSADNGTLTYQWGIVTGNTGNGTFTTVTNSSTYSGVLTPNLTINNTDLTLNNSGAGTKYKCEITEGNTTVTTFGAILSVYNTPTVVPTFTLSSNTVAANSTANLTLTIGNLNTASNDTVNVQRYLDTNGDGKIEAGKPLVENFAVTNNKVAGFGGVTDPTIPGDDTTVNGTIHTHINLSTSNEVGQVSGNYIIKIASPTGEFIPVTQILTVTQPNYGPSVSGQVTSNGTGVPFAPVALLQSTGSGQNQNQTFIAGTLTNATGNFTLNAPLGGNYALLGFAAGNVSPFASAPSFNLTSNTNLPGQNIGVTPATCMITGKVLDSVTNSSIASVQFFAQGNSTQSIATALSNGNGDFVIPVVADSWKMDFSDFSLPPLGYLRPSNKPTAVTTAETDSENNGGNNTLNAGITNITVSLLAVNALIYGTVTNGGSPLANVLLDGIDSNNNQANATTNSNGNYYMGVNGPTGGSGDMWNINADSNNPALDGLIPFSGNSFTVNANTAQEANFTTATVTAYLNGTVTDISNSTVLANLPIQVELTDNNPSGNPLQLQTTTDSNGNFSFGVYNGVWNIQLGYGEGNNTQNATLSTLVGESLNENVTNNTSISNISYSVLNATNTITGNVVDSNGEPVSNTNINVQTTANTTIGGLSYTSYTNTDSNGTYSLPVVNGTWNVYPGNQIYQTVMITVNGSSSHPITQNFAPSPYLVWVQNTFGGGQLGDPNTATETPANDGIPNLVKYALNELNPFTNQQQNLPKATLSNGALHLVFDKTASDITYTVQSSTDLVTWTTSDPSLLVEDCGEQVTAVYNLTGHPTAFLRILVTLNN